MAAAGNSSSKNSRMSRQSAMAPFSSAPARRRAGGDLLHTAWGYPCIGITRTVDVHIQHLRHKLGLKQEIQTIYRVGYTLS